MNTAPSFSARHITDAAELSQHAQDGLDWLLCAEAVGIAPDRTQDLLRQRFGVDAERELRRWFNQCECPICDEGKGK